MQASPEFRRWFDEKLPALMIAARGIIGSGREHRPMLLCYSHAGHVVPVPITGFDSIEAKDKVAYLHREMAKNPHMAAVVFISEAWTVDIDASEKVPASVAQDPRRFEVIIFSAIRGEQQLFATCRIERPGNTISEPVVTDPANPEAPSFGRMVVNRPH